MKMKVAEAVLEVTVESTTEEEVKRAYRAKALKWHPDKVSQCGLYVCVALSVASIDCRESITAAPLACSVQPTDPTRTPRGHKTNNSARTRRTRRGLRRNSRSSTTRTRP